MLQFWMLGAPGMRVLGGGARNEAEGRSGARVLPNRARAVASAPDLDPRTRTYLLALAELRKRRLTPTKRPWKARLGEPVLAPELPLPQGPAPRLPPLKPLIGPSPPGGKSGAKGAGVSPVVLEARIENALWTSFENDFDGVDVGVGRLSVYVAAGDGSTLRYIRLSDGKEVNPPFPIPGKGRRITVSHSADAPDVVWLVRENDLRTLAWRNGQWKDTPEQGCLDVAAGRADFATLPQLKDVYCATFDFGELKTLWIGSPKNWVGYQGSPTAWMPFTHTYANMGVAITTVAVERLPITSDDPAQVWFVRSDDQIGAASDPTLPLPHLPGGAWDIGAGAGELWALGTTQAPEPRSKGNTLWRFDPDAQRWDWIPGGWGMAIDLDAEGHVWVLDSDGRLHVRGARMPAVFEGFRAGPPNAGATKPDDCEPPPANDPAWNVYFQQLGDTLAEAGKLCNPTGASPLGPGLRPESIAEARSVGAGATIVMPPWDEFYADPTCTKKLAQQLLSKQRGVDVLFCLAPIFTRRPRVPPALIKALKLDSKKPDFANPGLMLAYVEHVKSLSAVPGFKERVRYFSLGNEVDVFFNLEENQGDEALWNSYITFCETVAPLIREQLPRARVGVNWTLPGIRDYQDTGLWHKMNEHLDVLIINYYPNPLAKTGRGAPKYAEEFQYLRELSNSFTPQKPIVLQEVGMPTSAHLGGSEALQNSFMKFLLGQWDDAGILLRFISWFQLYDYLYDDTLQVNLADENDPENSPILVVQSKYPKTASYQGITAPFWGIGNALAQAFLGPYRPNKPSTESGIASLDTAYWLNQSSTAGTPARALCEQFSTCGLICKNGRRKPAWYALRDWTKARRRLA